MLTDILEGAVTTGGWLDVVLKLGAAIGVVQLSSTWVSRTIGRRLTLAKKLRQLAAGASEGYFLARLGQPAFRQVEENFSNVIWVEPEFFAVARIHGGEVVAYAVTTRTRRFRPRLGSRYGVPGRVRLGVTTFAELPEGDEPGHINGGIGARRFGYSEAFYWGNPGGYRQFGFGVNDAGYERRGSQSIELLRAFEANDDAEIVRYRKRTRINTYAVTSPHGELKDLFPVWLGVDSDLVRVLDDFSRLSWFRRFQWWIDCRAARPANSHSVLDAEEGLDELSPTSDLAHE